MTSQLWSFCFSFFSVWPFSALTWNSCFFCSSRLLLWARWRRPSTFFRLWDVRQASKRGGKHTHASAHAGKQVTSVWNVTKCSGEPLTFPRGFLSYLRCQTADLGVHQVAQSFSCYRCVEGKKNIERRFWLTACPFCLLTFRHYSCNNLSRADEQLFGRKTFFFFFSFWPYDITLMLGLFHAVPVGLFAPKMTTFCFTFTSRFSFGKTVSSLITFRFFGGCIPT